MCQDAYGKQIERNISFFKPLPFLRPDVTNGDAEPDDTIDNMEPNNTNDDNDNLYSIRNPFMRPIKQILFFSSRIVCVC